MNCPKCNKPDPEYYPYKTTACKDCYRQASSEYYRKKIQDPEKVKRDKVRIKDWHDKNYDNCACGKEKKPASKCCIDCYRTPSPHCAICKIDRAGSGLKFHGYVCEMCLYRERRKERQLKPRNRIRDKRLQKLYGITLEEFNQMFKELDYKCQICKTDNWGHQGPHLDHDHTKTGRESVRGILCEACNLGIGKFKDNPEILARASEYLKQYNSK